MVNFFLVVHHAHCLRGIPNPLRTYKTYTKSYLLKPHSGNVCLQIMCTRCSRSRNLQASCQSRSSGCAHRTSYDKYIPCQLYQLRRLPFTEFYVMFHVLSIHPLTITFRANKSLYFEIMCVGLVCCILVCCVMFILQRAP